MVARRLYLTIFLVIGATICALAADYKNLEPLRLTTPEMAPELDYTAADLRWPEPATTKDDHAPWDKANWTWMHTNPGVKPYKVMDDLSFVGLPIFAAGLIIKGDKASFRQDYKNPHSNTRLITNFKTGIDDYTQFFGPAMTVGLKLGGYEGRSDWGRLLGSSLMSYAIMAGFVNGIKYSAKEMRPDGSTANSWPSGHTATSFVGATLLHKEYGLTRSPWFSVAGYGAATATGVMRVLNNRHWVSDVMSGAGIGILSTELGYAIGDLLFKGKGLLRNDLGINSEKPSFFSISMGLGIGNKSIDFNGADVIGYEGAKIEADEDDQIQFRAATVVDAEGAYFFNKYVGVGGRLRVRAMSAKSFGKYSEYLLMEDWNAWEGMIPSYEYCYPERFDKSTEIENYFQFLNDIGYKDTEDALKANAPVTDIHGVVKSDHLAEFTGSLGLYFNLPLGSHFALGTKALIGRSFTQELDIDGYAEGNKKDIDYIITMQNINGEAFKDLAYLDYPTNTGEKWTDEWDYLTLGAKSSTSFGTGLSLTYKYKSNFSWRLYCDYDYTEKDFTLKYDPYHFMKTGVTDATYALMQQASINDFLLEPIEFKKTKKMNYFTLGLAFLVNF